MCRFAEILPHRPPLSERKLRVALLVIEDLSNKEIAARLHLSPRTVQSHVASALTKLGLKSRVGLAVAVLRADVDGGCPDGAFPPDGG